MRRTPWRRGAVAMVAIALVSCRPPGPRSPLDEIRDTVDHLDRAYSAWYVAEVAAAHTHESLDRLAERDRAWDVWLGRVTRLLMHEGSQQALEDKITEARVWLVTIGALGPKDP